MIQVHGGNCVEISRRFGVDEKAIVDFSSNINPLGCPAAVKSLLSHGSALLSSYPDPLCLELREALASSIGCTPQHIIAGNGSMEFIYLIPRVLKPRRALVFTPSFSEYEKGLKAAGCAVETMFLQPKHGFRIPTEKVMAALSRVDMLVLCNPNNPTGVLADDNELAVLIAAARRKQVLVVVDEAFVDFAPDHSLVTRVCTTDHLMVMRSMTKFYGIPGIRLGYLVAPPHLVRKLQRCREPWTVNALAQKIGIACIADGAFAAASRNFIAAERAYLSRRLSAVPGVQPQPSAANYLLLNIDRTGLASGFIYETLATKGILIRDCRSFRGLGSRYIRVAVKRRRHNRLLLAALHEVVESYDQSS